METDYEIVGSAKVLPVKKGVKVKLQVLEVSCLSELIPKIPEEVQKEFAKEYGRLSDLLLIPIDDDALKALADMIQYWSLNLHVFEFPNLDACPTTEEYEVLLNIGSASRLKLYQYTDNQEVTEDSVEKAIGVRPGPTNIIKQGGVFGLKTSFLKKHIVKTVEHKDWDSFRPTFALAIYDMVLFPFVYDMID